MSKPMDTGNAPIEQKPLKNTESVAHQIIGEFLTSLEAKEGFAEISKRLKPVMLSGKPTEAALRAALFGDPAL